jgi:endonuclease/exonuclease/phosphatase family metal-dependent hydrolase
MLSACAPIRIAARHSTAETRVTVDGPIAWFSPSVAADDTALARWRDAVGPPVVRLNASANLTPSYEITVVSWNIANGAGDVIRFARTLPQGAPLVMLLQEAYRGGPEVPATLKRDASFAGRLGGATASPDTHEIEAVAAALGLNIYYVPSMRNGGATSDEDRGNAILSNLPLSGLAALELPLERQRRVAIAATVHGRGPTGEPWQMRVMNVHLDNLRPLRRGWISGEYGRTRQARAVRQVLGDQGPAILGGDFNTWFGFSEKAYIETALAFPQTRVTDERATFRGLLRLDHLFFRLAPAWQAAFHRADDRFGSDHYPLVGRVLLQ